ncbi:MAG TPA: EAL domain-containing protein [Candidatus Methylomirabilis sp.]|nr:EAL domain-containing protein [Candidatus Methylomirabilis sp.]
MRDAANKVKPATKAPTNSQQSARGVSALKESEIRYRRLFETAQDGILILDHQTGAITDVNPYLIKMLEYSRKELVRKKLWEVGAFQNVDASKAAFTALKRREYSRHENLPLRTKDGRLVQVEFISNVYRVGNKKVIQCNIRDITERKQAEQQLEHQALRDALTGLFNRLVFTDRLTQAFERAKRNPAYRYAVLFLDLDRFKVINDSLGHFAGDQLLIAVARRLEKRLRAADTLARLGGDEFAIMLDNSSEVFEAVRVAHRLQGDLAPAFTIEGREVFTTASIGIAESGPTYKQPEELLRDADIALYRAKELGGARYAVFDAAMHDRAVALLHLETELRRALERQEIRIYYQPIVSLATKQLYGFETLIRWQHPTRGLLLPEEFIALAEETSLLNPIGEWMLREACSQMREWQTRFPTSPPLTISVNLSHRQFLQPNLIELVTRTLEETGLAAQQLCLEITENVILQEEPAPGIIRDLRHLGVQLHIDDFGTGYSSLGALYHAELTALKIDRAFIRLLDGTNRQSAIARTALLLARELGLATIAEGVETPEQLAYLKTLECEYAQGYLFAKPMDTEAATGLLVSVFQPKGRQTVIRGVRPL